MAPLQVAIVGSGNFGTAIARLAAINAAEKTETFVPEVIMWTFQEKLADGSLLTDKINSDHENVKYLPGVQLPHNLVAEPDAVKTVRSADLLVFISPHQFTQSICAKIRGQIKPSARAITFIKGLLIDHSAYQPQLLSQVISKELGGIPCDAMSGANLANEVARDRFCETTLGCCDPAFIKIWTDLFQTPNFQVRPVHDVAGVQVCGALKNVVAVAAGFSDGVNWGLNTKSAIIARGLNELRSFAQFFFPDVHTATYFESAGIADIITTCFGGRNVRMAAEYARRNGQSSWDQLEIEILAGQKMQGHLTIQEMMEVIDHHHLQKSFPLTVTLHTVCFNKADPRTILDAMRTTPAPLPITTKKQPATPSTATQ